MTDYVYIKGSIYYSYSVDNAVKISCKVKPKILTHPASVSVKEGKTVSFKVKAVGDNMKFQWFVMKKGADKWSPMKGKTAATLKLTAKKSMNGFKYRCRVKNTWGEVTSKAAKLTVK